MFDAFLGKKFTVKCKHAIKCINERLKPIRNRKQAVVNILKKDIADLLRNGSDSRAFSRMDELIIEMNRLACYDIIENFCQCLYKQLPLLQKQRECPPEDMESVSTLIFAAARFSDLPELCNLRTVFMMRYGNPLEGFVNPEFKDKAAAKSFPPAKKLQLMKDIACEFNVNWDSASFNHENPAASYCGDLRSTLQKRHKKGHPPAVREDATSMGRDQEPVRKPKKVWAAEPENVTPPPPIASPLPRENIKHEETKRVAAPFRAREERNPQVNDGGGLVVNQPKPKEDAVAAAAPAAARSRVRPLFSPETSNGGDSTAVGRRSTRSYAKVNAIDEEKVSDRDGPRIYSKVPTWRQEGGLQDPQAAKHEGRNAGGAAKERAPVGLTGATATAPPPQRAVKERTLHSIPPPYVKTVVGPKAERHQPPSPPPEKPGRKEDEDEKEEPRAVYGERPKPRSMRRKPPPPVVAAAGEEATPPRRHHERRRIIVGDGEGLDEEENVEQLLIHYSRKDKGKEPMGPAWTRPDSPSLPESDELAARFAGLKAGGAWG
ncbi:unnamed protein product [Spirodela intermedia]|uniref:Uncharacterized protein n=1 Tax=Spirodela intermedia TaxID=51605 RepID=A0A7I8LIE4_SPIIN|nr:unnamed protein product [Spirodela intermedia]